MRKADLKSFLEENYNRYNRKSFIELDPVSIPHRFSIKEDIEISGFLSATIAWGQRKTILRNGAKLMELMDNEPYQFILNASSSDFKKFNTFVHRTFNGADCIYFLQSLQNLYKSKSGIEHLFTKAFLASGGKMDYAISIARSDFFSIGEPGRTSKHFADPVSGSAAKRINMFLRWMVRKDRRGVDFGIWNSIKPADLYCPLDVHSGRVARELGLLKRKQNDWKAVEELTSNLRLFDSNDPVKYDYALYGLGVSDKL